MSSFCHKCGLNIPYEKCHTLPICTSCEHYALRMKRSNKSRDKNNGTTYQKKKRDKAIVKFNSTFAEWKVLLSRVSNEYPRLTQDQFNLAIAHFNGKCAMCQIRPATHRTYFIRPFEGGAYTDYNIIPSCEKCYNIMIDKRVTNPFKSMSNIVDGSQHTTRYKYGWTTTKLKSIIAYLEPKLLDAITWSNLHKVYDTNNKSVT